MFNNTADYDLTEEFELSKDIDAELSQITGFGDVADYDFMVTGKDVNELSPTEIKKLAQYVNEYVNCSVRPEIKEALVNEIVSHFRTKEEDRYRTKGYDYKIEDQNANIFREELLKVA